MDIYLCDIIMIVRCANKYINMVQCTAHSAILRQLVTILRWHRFISFANFLFGVARLLFCSFQNFPIKITFRITQTNLVDGCYTSFANALNLASESDIGE